MKGTAVAKAFGLSDNNNATQSVSRSRSLGRDLNFGPSEYEAGVQTTRPRPSVFGSFAELFTDKDV
jgi:hypothetical protein